MHLWGLKTVVSNQERDWVMKFLMGLHDWYKGIKAQILSIKILLIKPFPKLNEAYFYWCAPTSQTMSLAAHGKYMGRQNGFSQKKYYCTFCMILGHSIGRCFKANPNKLSIQWTNASRYMDTLWTTNFMARAEGMEALPIWLLLFSQLNISK